MEDYCVDEKEDFYERYLDGRSMEDSVSIYLEEDESYDEIESLQKENAALRRKLNELLRERQDQRDNAHVMEESLNNNVDVLRRISQLEREVYHKNKD